jgi:hypothetical protein
MHVPRRLYEGLPWLYITLGLAALAYSYLASSARALSLIAGLAGLAGVLAGAVLLLRRREFRALGERYGTGGAARGRQPGDAPRPPPDRDFD